MELPMLLQKANCSNYDKHCQGKTDDINARQGANRKQVGHLLRIRNAAWR